MYARRVRKIGDGLGVLLPKEIVARLKLAAGDRLVVTDCPEGVRLTPPDSVVERQVEAAPKVTKKRRSALRDLGN
jgi:putative addiction module antidote